MSDKVDIIVVGAGVVGLAIARTLATRGREVLIIEAEGDIGTGTSSRNSEVVHAGIYYPKGSLKARLCVEGRDRLYSYCEANGVAVKRLGKLLGDGVDPKVQLGAAKAALEIALKIREHRDLVERISELEKAQKMNP